VAANTYYRPNLAAYLLELVPVLESAGWRISSNDQIFGGEVIARRIVGERALMPTLVDAVALALRPGRYDVYDDKPLEKSLPKAPHCVTFFDFMEEVPCRDIEQAIERLRAAGATRIHVGEVFTGTDSYAWVISARRLTPRQIDTVWSVNAFEINAAIIREDPTNAGAHIRLAKVLRERGDEDGANEIYLSVLSFDPQNVIASNHVAKAGSPGQSTKVDRVNVEEMYALLTSARAATIFGDVSELGPFSHQWPKGKPEDYDVGWEVHAEIGSARQVAIQHRLGFRDTWAQNRRRGVTFVSGVSAVEGDGCDGYSLSHALVSVLKRSNGQQHVQTRYELPGGYQGFTIVRHDDEIEAKGSFRCLALKLLEDDVVGWATHALLRSLVRGIISWEGG
jgi:hypothetical protein